MSPSTFTIAAYGEGALYPSSNLRSITSSVQSAGWNTLIFGLFHIGRVTATPPQIEGDIYFNGTLIISQGKYLGDENWPAAVHELIGGSVTTLLASVGGATPWVKDFATIQTIYQNNKNSFQGTNLQKNFLLFHQLFPDFEAIDMDNEDNYDQTSFVAFCHMLIAIGFNITFCPYTEQDFWTGSLAAIEEINPGAVIWWNLQCYAGGSGNDPQIWAGYITQVLPNFNTTRYILASDWSRFWNSDGNYWQGDCPNDTESLLAGFKAETCVGGAFIWTLDQILGFDTMDKAHPGSGCSSGGGSQEAYVNAIRQGLLLQ
ncbi:MAG: hypothetical protein ABIQ40_03585 [Bacteroidia bacterium]